MKHLQINESIEVTVQANDPWYKSNVMLYKEQSYSFVVVPDRQTWIDGKWLKPFTADGRLVLHLLGLYPFIRMPRFKWFALLGYIDSKRSTYFKIGENLPHYSPSIDGKLICFANDALKHYENNNGQIKFIIRRNK
jgi:hypothetical protein